MDGHTRWTGVVPFESPFDVTREADVVTIGIGVAAEDVDEAARFHAGGQGRNDAGVSRPNSLELIRGGRRSVAVFAVAASRADCRNCKMVRLRSPSGELRRDRLRMKQTRFRRGQRSWPRRSSAKPSEVWLGGRDSNPDNLLQRQMSYRWTTSQYLWPRSGEAETLIISGGGAWPSRWQTRRPALHRSTCRSPSALAPAAPHAGPQKSPRAD